MADNVEIIAGGGSPGPGEIVAADEIAGAKYQRIKLVLGADGSNEGDVASGNPLPVGQKNAANTYGEQSVPVGNTVTLVTYSAGAGWKLRGFIAGGEVDGKFFVQINGTTKYVIRTNIAQRQALLLLPNPDAAAGGATVTLRVENTGEASGTFEGTLIGE